MQQHHAAVRHALLLRVLAVLVGGLLLTAVAGCGPAASEDELIVLAAASLTDAFGEIERAFETANPGVDVQLNLGASSALREQILQGIPADVFASANQATMDVVVDAQAVLMPTTFATNRLELAVPVANPGLVDEIADVADPSLLVGLCAVGVPCGDFARVLLQHAGVDPAIDTNEPDARALTTKLEAGELDVGIVYRTDVVANSALGVVPIDPAINVTATYPIASLRAAPAGDLANDFVEFVLSDEGQDILASFGFGAP